MKRLLKRRIVKRLIVVNALAALAYVALAIAGALVIGLVFLLLMWTGVLHMSPAEVSTTTIDTSIQGSKLAVGAKVLLYIVAAVALIVTIGLLVAFPYLIGKWFSRILKRIQKILRINDTRKDFFLLKLLVCVIPLIGFIVIHIVATEVVANYIELFIVTFGLVIAAIMLFSVQLFLARWLRIHPAFIW